VVDLLVNIDVDDLDRAIEFYRAALGFTLKRRLFDDTVAEMAGASSRLFLLKKDAGTVAAPGATTARDYRRHWTPVHLDVAVGDLDASVARALAAGATLEGDVQAYGWGRIAFLAEIGRAHV